MTDRTTTNQPPQAHQDKHPRTIQDALKDAIKRLPHAEQKRVHKLLLEKGVLKHDDKAG
jgi:hypothetical protein